MLNKIKNFVLAHLVQSALVVIAVIIGIGGASYFAFQKGETSDNTNENTLKSNTKLCSEFVSIGTISVEEDPAGDPEAWLRFDYTTTADQAVDCQYTITFYDSQENVIRKISDVEDAFQSPSGQIYNGYSSTPYQVGMTARITIQ